VPVVLRNDANVGLLGEWVAGAARGHDDVLGLWLGTGIGGGLITSSGIESRNSPYDPAPSSSNQRVTLSGLPSLMITAVRSPDVRALMAGLLVRSAQAACGETTAGERALRRR